MAKSNDGNSNYTLAAANSNDEWEWWAWTIWWWGWGWGWEYTCQPSQWHERSSVTYDPSNMDITHVYKSLMVWVNTDAPQATLDVNGSIRIWGNCFPLYTRCSDENVWTIMYAENSSDWFLVMCMKKNWSYVRYDVINNELQENFIVWFWLWDDDLHCDLPKPTPGNYPSFTWQASQNHPLEY